VARTLREDSALRAIYEQQLRLTERLTNPLVGRDLREFLGTGDGAVEIPDGNVQFFPPSVSHETELIKKLYGSSPIPDGFVLADEMVRRIRVGELDLTPRAESGWYDHQTWALEPLVIPDRMPEAPSLSLDDEYRELLVELFKGLLTLTRETHIKQLEVPIAGAAWGGEPEVVIEIAPELSAEPLPTFYLRRALGYRFVRGVLEESFGPGELDGMHRLTADGPVDSPLGEELADMEALFLGAHAKVSRQLGCPTDPTVGDEVAADAVARRFTGWAGNAGADPDLRRDVRTMVPVFYDIERGKTKVWVFLGWSNRPIWVSFARRPGVTVLGRDGRPAAKPPTIEWGGLPADIFYPVTAEVYVDRILDRDGFRKLCDTHGTRSAILRELAGA
jgi:hypothetical protein